MAFQYHVAGPIIPQAGVGSLGALVPLGVCYDGATIDLRPARHPIKSDGGGGPEGEAVEWIFLNYMAIIRFKLVSYDDTAVNALRAMSIASVVEGQAVTPGTLYGANGFLPGLYLPSSDAGGPWNFPNVSVVRPGGVQVSTKETQPDWEFQAMIYFAPSAHNSINGLPLYTRAAP